MQLQLFPKTTVRSPLQYLGGKSRVRAQIAGFFPRIETLVSPFFGGGSVELFLAERDNAVVFGYDIYEPVVAAWQCLLHKKEALITKLESMLPWVGTSKEDDLQKINFNTLIKVEPKLDRAALLIFKCCLCWGSKWSGRSVRNNIFVDGTRVIEKPSKILLDTARIKEFIAPTLTVGQNDFRETLAQHKDEWAYLDPPYIINDGDYYVKHEAFPHEDLARLLWERKQFVLSYNNCNEVKELYPTHRFKHYNPEWHYGIGNKASNELIIIPK